MPKRYVAYTNLNAKNPSGSYVDPDDYGGLDSEEFNYLLEHENVVPLGHPAASIAMGEAPEDTSTASDAEEVARLRARVAELEAAQPVQNKPVQPTPPVAPTSTSTPASTQARAPAAGASGASGAKTGG
jgi:hypothetical protein